MSHRNVANRQWAKAFGHSAASTATTRLVRQYWGLNPTEFLNLSSDRSYFPKRLTCSQAAADPWATAFKNVAGEHCADCRVVALIHAGH
jgi:hypothetical protein